MASSASCVSAASLSHPSVSGHHRGTRSLGTLLPLPSLLGGGNKRWRTGTSTSRVVCMAPEEEKMTRRSPLDFPILVQRDVNSILRFRQMARGFIDLNPSSNLCEWERPKPGRRPDIFPQFSPMKTPLPPPLPADPPEEDEEEEERKEEEEDPEKEEPDNPEKQSRK